MFLAISFGVIGSLSVCATTAINSDNPNQFITKDMLTGKEELFEPSSSSRTLHVPELSVQNSSRIGLNSVIGTDNDGDGYAEDRHEMSPYDQRIVYIHATFPDGFRGRGTGAIVANRLILTAAHVLYDASRGGWATSVSVDTVSSANTTTYGSADSTKIFANNSWTQSPSVDYDYGFIEINKDLASKVGGFGASAYPSLTGKSVVVTGYPGDKGDYVQYTASGTVISETSTRIFHDVDTEGGESGSPILYNDNIVGIHTSGTSTGSTYNAGVKVNSSIISTILSYR